MEKIIEGVFNLLGEKPVLSIILGSIMTLVILWMFRGTIVEIIKKKFELYTEDEILESIDNSLGNYWAQTISDELRGKWNN